MYKLYLCLVYPGYPPYEHQGGGISSVAYELTNGLINYGHEVTIITRITGIKSIIREVRTNLAIYYIPSDDYKLIDIHEYFGHTYFGSYLFSQKVYKLINVIEKKRKFDVIEFCDWGAEAYFTMNRMNHKVILRCSTPSFISQMYNSDNIPYYSEFVYDLEKYVITNSKNILCNSDSLIKKIEDAVNKKIYYTNMEIPLLFDKSKNNRKIKQFTKNNPLKILMVGRVEKRKGFDLLIDLLPKFKNNNIHCSVTIVGSSTKLIENSNSIDYYKEKNIHNLYLLGHIPRKDMREIYCSHDLFIMPSRYESFGYVAAEAIRENLPSIISSACTISTFFEDMKSEMIFETENKNCLFAKIKFVYDNYDRAIEISEKALDILKSRISLDVVLPKHIEYYKMICNKPLKMY